MNIYGYNVCTFFLVYVNFEKIGYVYFNNLGNH